MTTRVLLVRHGATVHAAEDRFASSAGVELSDEGRMQACSLAERLASEPLAAIYASPMKRTMDTANILADPHDLTAIPTEGLEEISHGYWEGLLRSEAQDQFPEEFAAWEADPFTFAPRDGEAGLHVLARALPVLREIVIRHDEELVLIISHKATIRLLISSLLGFDARGYRDRLDQHPCGLNILDFKDPVRVRLMLYNDVSHYEDVPKQITTRHLSTWWDPVVSSPRPNYSESEPA